MQYNPYQTHSDFFSEIDKGILKFVWKFKRPRIAKTVLEKKNKVEGLTLPNFKCITKPQ